MTDKFTVSGACITCEHQEMRYTNQPADPGTLHQVSLEKNRAVCETSLWLVVGLVDFDED
jgi:hypothetical protein